MERTGIYVLSSAIVSLVGLILLLADRRDATTVSIATSLIAGGLASIAFAIIRYFDDQDGRQTATEIRNSLSELKAHALVQRDLLDGLRRNISLAAAADGRVFDRHPEDEVAELVDSHRGPLEVDICGLTLRPFMRDQFARIQNRGDTKLRLLLQHPGEDAFARVCGQEGRDFKRMLDEALSVTRDALSGSNDSSKLVIEVRWFTELPTLTMVRVSGVVYVRPRFIMEAHQGRVFFERYVLEDGVPYHIYHAHFIAAWDSSFIPTLDDCDDIVGRLRT